MRSGNRAWQLGFFGGIIALNLLLVFRKTAFATGGAYRVVWTGLVIMTGVLLVYSLLQRPRR